MKKFLLLEYGHSGVSFLRDFMKEIDNNYVFEWEFWITILAGGIFDIGHTIETNSNIIDDSSIRRYFKLRDYLFDNKTYSELFNEKFLDYSKDFESKLIISKAPGSTMWNDMNEQIKFPKLKFLPKKLRPWGFSKLYQPVRDINYDDGMYFLNTMNEQDYVNLAKEYLDRIYSLFPKKEYLTLVHPIMVSGKYDKQLQYFDDNDKIIRINRDPRDVYVNLIRDIPSYTVADSAEHFIAYFKKRHFNDEYNNKNSGSRILNIQFEEFVINYDKVEKKILDFCEIDISSHVKRFEFSKPEISIKNIGLYKDYANQKEIKLIETELEPYLFNGG